MLPNKEDKMKGLAIYSGQRSTRDNNNAWLHKGPDGQ